MTSPDMVICRCEEVGLGKLLQTAAAHGCSARELKLRTRAGMGTCGGRSCRSLILAMLEESASQAPGHDMPLGCQPPVRPVSFSMLGGTE
ncbi:(2Fe-2S)-binding protein [Brevibacillus panacihumi]|uniref:(2Fe-2S)-binding protein n=1 Tax=Brevibacillus panacihumi TaxID=497735 RepID=A0A3M8CMZ1_9BACL|nr:(2Fe-2S)-binding protein [Brevibacillus panacihumi]RNB76245.1 (2Fe-2S)-binding protein [Brevibacillus panacihumi]